jgi:hypothetical protein
MLLKSCWNRINSESWMSNAGFYEMCNKWDGKMLEHSLFTVHDIMLHTD